MWFKDGKCDKVKTGAGIVVVIILFLIAWYFRLNLVTGVTALIAGILIGMFLCEKCAMKAPAK